MKYKENIHRVLEIALKLIGIILIWEYGAGFFGIPDYILPLPSTIAIKFYQTFSIQIYHLSITALTTIIEIGMGLIFGIPLALSVICIRPVKGIVLPVLAALNSIPKIAIAPLFVIWFGLGEIESDILDLAQLAGGNEFLIFRKVRLMNALLYITPGIWTDLLVIIGSTMPLR